MRKKHRFLSTCSETFETPPSNNCGEEFLYWYQDPTADEGCDGSSSAGEAVSSARWCRTHSLRAARMSSSAGVSRSMRFRRSSATCLGAASSMAARSPAAARPWCGADWRRRGQMLDDLLGFLHEWWTTTPVSWESEFFSLPPVHADLRPVQAGGPPVWIGGASEAAMRRVGRIGTGWLGVDGLQDSTDHLWSIARRAAQDAGRDPDALKTAMRINLEPGTSVDSLVDKLERFAGSGIDEAIVDAFALFPSLDQMLDFASQVITKWSNRR